MHRLIVLLWAASAGAFAPRPHRLMASQARYSVPEKMENQDWESIFSLPIEYVSDSFVDQDQDSINLPFKFESQPVEIVVPKTKESRPTTQKRPGSNILELGILPSFGGTGPLFPSSREFLFIFEMRYRTLMNDAEQVKGLLGRCFVNDNEEVASYGSFCRIKESRKLVDGKGFFIIESVSRFRIRRILQRSPYIRAEVELISDEEFEKGTKDDALLAHSLATSLYSSLKQYLRINRVGFISEEEEEEEEEGQEGREGREGRGEVDYADGLGYYGTDEVVGFGLSPIGTAEGFDAEGFDEDEDSPESTDDLILTPAVRDARPLTLEEAVATPAKELLDRYATLSHAVANLLHKDSEVLQQLLQVRSLVTRLRCLRSIIAEAVTELSEALLDDHVITEAELEEIRIASIDPLDDDSLLLPPDTYTGLSLEDELNDDLSQRLGMSSEMFVSRSLYDATIDDLVTSQTAGQEEAKGSPKPSPDPFDDPQSAFQ